MALYVALRGTMCETLYVIKYGTVWHCVTLYVIKCGTVWHCETLYVIKYGTLSLNVELYVTIFGSVSLYVALYGTVCGTIGTICSTKSLCVTLYVVKCGTVCQYTWHCMCAYLWRSVCHLNHTSVTLPVLSPAVRTSLYTCTGGLNSFTAVQWNQKNLLDLLSCFRGVVHCPAFDLCATCLQ